jgi:hypothetical protein
VEGSANIYPFLTPNIGDYFIADAGHSMTGIYRVRSVERRSHNRDTVYGIDFNLVGYSSENKEIFDDLFSKSIKEYYFSKDRLIENLQPLVKKEEYDILGKLKRSYIDLIRYYFKSFFNREYMTIVVPGQAYSIYDHFVLKFLLRLVESNDTEELKYIRSLPIDLDKYLEQPQLYSVLLERNYDLLKYCNKQMGLAVTKEFNRSPYMLGLAYSSVRNIVYPIDVDESVNVAKDQIVKYITVDMIGETKNSMGLTIDNLDNQYNNPPFSYQLFKSVLIDEYYVLSEKFYEGDSDQCVLEILTKDYLKGNTINIYMLTMLVNRFKMLPRLEQFYYGPIIFILIKDVIRNIYS